MAQVFPLNVDDLSPDGERASLAGTLAALPDPWTLLRHRRIGAFEAAPRLSVTDADWADAVIELLMVPDDLAMAPVGETVRAPMPEPELPPARRERFEESPRDLYQRSPALDGSEPPLPLMVDWPFAASYERKRRRGWVAALVIIPLLLAGAGFAAWEYAGEDKTVATNDTSPPSQIEIPLPPQSRGDRAAGQPAASSPPPVPAAPPSSPPAAEPPQPAPARMAATSPPDSGPAPPAPQEEPPRSASKAPATT